MKPPPLKKVAGYEGYVFTGWVDPPPLPLPALDMALLADLPSLELQARYMAHGFLSGRHRSHQKGSSVEFAEYRNYQFGDDLRRVDWRLYGRTNRLHLKQYEEETQLRVFLVLDTSASMDYRSRAIGLRKIEFARVMLAAIGLVAHRQGDAFGLGIAAGTELKDFLRARSSEPHWQTLVGKLDSLAPHRGETSLASVLEILVEVVPPRSLIVIASDFYEETERLAAALRRLRCDHHDLLGLHVLDAAEVDFDLEDSGTFEDAEDGAQLKLDSAAVRQGYLQRFGKFCDELAALFHSVGGETARVRTDAHPVDALTRYLAQRRRKR
jgi:uncharacterized protein (DUF58 family)